MQKINSLYKVSGFYSIHCDYAEKIKEKSPDRELITVKTKIEYNVFQIVG